MASPRGLRQPLVKSKRAAGAGTDAEKASTKPSRNVLFQVELLIAPEPRMSLSLVRPVELTEAVDDKGNSLLAAGRLDVTPSGPMNGSFGSFGYSGLHLTSIAPLHRPENPGNLIKTLRGSFEVTVSARHADPLVIPLEGAAGKTFQNDSLHVAVGAIESLEGRLQDTIELAIDEIDQLYPQDASAGMAPGTAQHDERDDGLDAQHALCAHRGRQLDRPGHALPDHVRPRRRSNQANRHAHAARGNNEGASHLEHDPRQDQDPVRIQGSSDAVRARRTEAPSALPPLRRTSDYMGGLCGMAKRSGLPVFWQIAHDVRLCFLSPSHKEATTRMVVETQSAKKPLRFPARAARLPSVGTMGRRVGR